MAKEINNPNEELDIYPIGSIFPLTDEETGEEVRFILRGKTVIDDKLYFAMVFADDEDATECYIFAVDEDGDDLMLSSVEDDDEFEKVEDYFNDLFFNEVDYDA